MVYGESPLPPDYTVFGTIGEPGLAVIDAVAAAGSDSANGPGDGAPNQPVTIESAAVS
jgi:peptidyl-prolyl cis-trans isomerase B (cyclophilin B)